MGIFFGKLKRLIKKEEEVIDYDKLIEEVDRPEGVKPTFLFGNEEDEKYPYPIKKSMAEEIARKSQTLKTDFCRNSNRECITFLGFGDYSLDIIEKEGKKYWQYQVFNGDISWVEFSEKNETYCDGNFSSEDLKYLRCLIDVETGDYIYYPDVKDYKERTIKYEELFKKDEGVIDKFPIFFSNENDDDNKGEKICKN